MRTRPSTVPDNMYILADQARLDAWFDPLDVGVVADHAVLELGGRYGTTACVLAEATNNSGRVVSVEPDPAAHAALRHNLRTHSCRVGVFRGTVGRRDQLLLPRTDVHGRNRSYDMQTRDVPFATAGAHDGSAQGGAPDVEHSVLGHASAVARGTSTVRPLARQTVAEIAERAALTDPGHRGTAG